MNKKIKHITAILILILGIQSCDDYVDILPPGRENSEDYFNSSDDYENALIGVYDLLSTTYLNNILGEIASDNSLCGGENATDVLDWQQIDDMIHTPDNGALRNIFQWMYAGISRANYIMEFKNKTDFEGKDQIIAENLFLRSYFYFELVKFFGDVPLYTDKRITIEETQAIDRTPKAEVYAQLEQDLLTAIDDLPWQQSQPGKVTKGAALALLGKIYLFQDKFSESASVLNEVIESGQYSLIQDFSTIFLNENENNAESVFEIQYFGGSEGASFDCFVCVEGNIAVGFMGPRFRGGNYEPYDDGYSFNIPVQELVDLYEPGDTRLDATIFNIEDFVASHPDVTYLKGDAHTGYFNKKYIPYDEAILEDSHINHSNNYRAIRYSDVLLMAAEANLRATTPVRDPQALLDAVRDRAFGDTNHRVPATLENIWLERRLELAGEGQRFFDLIRTGKAEEEIENNNGIDRLDDGTLEVDKTFEAKNVLFPIPRIEIELAGNRWEQNPGYN
ncbi:RagB/SusD family nutrient uptake outer membrane protein [Abyssalbus ytuae]|uniref:RagB/SusD family nutrient uptake outer membrane protein n=1 Tax=Abyssalbus ytuae TaxID=2926907 RepID=A0A9E7D2L2_9FLAO|nr:RagB/SusD family nutrient uptake outer membrane protein [Abyssalbus ytuae]UOB16794.1 RagB/SusD family nutrient uptake outer membrane protein [Abyssalbus ytuae]